MSNELTTLPQFTRNLFRHAFWVLPWFCRNHRNLHFPLRPGTEMSGYISAIQKDRCLIFGPHPDLTQANQTLNRFYDSVQPAGGPKANQTAMENWSSAWKQAWNNRRALQLRGHEVRLMKYFRQVFCALRTDSLPVLVSMARLIDRVAIQLARSIVIRGYTARKALEQANREWTQITRSLFGSQPITAELVHQVARRKPRQYRVYRRSVSRRREAARLRMIERFDEENWYPIVDVDLLAEKLREDGIVDLIPAGFRGRVSVQPSGYPLTFYTYAGLELEKPPLNQVEMNPQYGHREPDKKYRIHPVDDGTFYCVTHAAVGDSITKHYTLEYKRRARKLKYDSVRALGQTIEDVRRRMIEHLSCNHRNTWVRAVMCLFMDLTCARIGNSASAEREIQAFGVTTIRTREHVRIHQDALEICYMGKHQQAQRHHLSIQGVLCNKEIEYRVASKIVSLANEKREFLFTQHNGRPFTPDMVNEYFTCRSPAPESDLPFGGAGAPCTVHNLRNYHATRIFMNFVRDFAKNHSQPTYEDLLIAYQGCSASRKRNAEKGILQTIAELLGNTPGICRRAYIDPREQLMFFRRWGYRPPDALIRDLYENEDADPYGLEEMLVHESRCLDPNKKIGVSTQ